MRKVLIVVDMQNDFVTGSLGTPEAQAIVPRVVKKINECMDDRYDIFFTQDTHFDDFDDDNYLDSLEGKYLPVKHCINITEGWQIIDELENLATIDKRIVKTTFGYDDWEYDIYNLIMRQEDYEALSYFSASNIRRRDKNFQFELIGLCTDICVISNALILRAQFPNSEIIVHADCCAGTTPEKHAAALEVMKSCQILIKGE